MLGNRFDPQWDPIRRNLGHALRLARQLDLAAMVPHDKLASTGYCLAAPGRAYLVYVPTGGKATVSLQKAESRFAVQWFGPSNGKTIAGAPVSGGEDCQFVAPFSGDAVLTLSRS